MTENDRNGEMSFAELFESTSETSGRKLSPGEKVSGRVVKISKDTVFVDLGGKSEGIAGITEFFDKEGNLSLREGDWVEMRVALVRDGIHLQRG